MPHGFETRALLDLHFNNDVLAMIGICVTGPAYAGIVFATNRRSLPSLG